MAHGGRALLNPVDPGSVDVFVVEDDPRLLFATASLLRDEGLEVRAFSRPSVALLALPSALPNVIVTSMDMPEMSGIELMERVREIFGTDAPRFVLIADADLPRALRVGFDDVLQRPFGLDELLAHVRRVEPRRRASGTVPRYEEQARANAKMRK